MKKFYKITKCIILAATFTAFCATSLAAQDLKKVVGVVRQQFTEETNAFFDKAEADFNDAGFDDYAKVIKGFRNDCWGTGFIYVASNGKNYAVTNRHVVPSKEKASIEFELEDGSFKKYENLEVLAFDENTDIALLGFPEGEKPFASGLVFAASKVQDGDDVWSAGFPGLGNEVLWQLGKGTVTNSSARIKDLINPEISTLIQHSAQVDSGNSGGPLLRRLSGNKYEVVGINTWKATYRDSTNYSIPVSVVKKFIDNYFEGSLVKDKELKTVLNDFLSTLNDEDKNIIDVSDFLAFAAVSENGVTDVVDAYRRASNANRQAVNAAFASNPVRGMATASVISIYKKFTAEDFSKNCEFKEPVEQTDGSYSVEFAAENESLKTIWVSENSKTGKTWKLLKIDDGETSNKSSKKKTTKTDKKKSSGSFYIDDPMNIYLYGGYIPYVTRAKGFAGMGLGASISIYNIEVETGYDGTLKGSSGKGVIPLNALFNLAVPVSNGEWFFIPHGGVGFGMVFNAPESDSNLGILFDLGLKAGYEFDSCSVFGFVEYRRTSSSILGFAFPDDGSQAYNKFAVGIGVGF